MVYIVVILVIEKWLFVIYLLLVNWCFKIDRYLVVFILVCLLYFGIGIILFLKYLVVCWKYMLICIIKVNLIWCCYMEMMFFLMGVLFINGGLGCSVLKYV